MVSTARVSDVVCPACRMLFGKEAGEAIEIKLRDITRRVTGGVVEGPCRRCGTYVVWKPEGADDSRHYVYKGSRGR